MPNYFQRGTTDLDAAGGGSLPHARARRTTLLSVATSTVTAVPFEAEPLDTSGFFDVAAPTRLTIPAGQGGVYQVGWNLRWAANGTGTRVSWLRPNASATLSYGSAIAAGNGVLAHSGVAVVPLVAGDYLELMVHQDSGAALDIQASPDADYTYLWLARIS